MKSSWALPEGQCPLQRCAAFSAADALWVQLPTKYPYVHAQLLISYIWILLQKPSQGGQSSKPLMIIKNKWFTYYQYSWDYKTINQIKLFRTSNPDLAYFSHFLPRFTELCAYSKLLKEVKHLDAPEERRKRFAVTNVRPDADTLTSLSQFPMPISNSFQETIVFLENTKRSTLGICNKQYFLFLYSSSPKGCRSFSGRNGYCKMNCSLQYFHWQFSETVSSSLSNCFWSTKEEHELLKENYFDTAGTVPCLNRLT